MDILSHDVVEKIYTEPMVKQCLSAGWGPITYRQNTELSIGAWHWNPNGTWSDAANKRGYFTGSTELKDPIRHSYGYPLPHRGHTRNGGAEHGYSRLTDGNPDIVLEEQSVSRRASSRASRIRLTRSGSSSISDRTNLSPTSESIGLDPYARSYEVQYWVAEKTALTARVPWSAPRRASGRPFPTEPSPNGKGGTPILQLSSTPVPVRYLRIWMTRIVEHRRLAAQRDARSERSRAAQLGYAIREIYVGTLTPAGEFVDLIQHRADQNQTPLSARPSTRGTPSLTSTLTATRPDSICSSPAASRIICPQ